MESITYLKNQDITPKKLRMFLPKVKKMSPVEATKVLFYSPNRAAQVFYKAIKSAISNAKQTLKVSDDLLQFKLFTIEEGNKLRRYTAGSRGNAKPFKKRYSHIKIILVAKTETEAPVKAMKELKKKTAVKSIKTDSGKKTRVTKK